MSRAREEVLAVVAHDLRNPLNLVASSAQLLTEPGLDQARRDSIYGIASRAVRRMNRMVGDLLNVVRMESGTLSLELKPTDASRMIAETAQAAGATAAERGITIVVETPSEPLTVTVDEERVPQLLDNLVGNALKFTPHGGRVVIAAAVEADAVRLSVSDTGPGISPEHVARLFDRFWQARGADRRGIGLGLTIAKGIAEAHGGRLSVESSLGNGTVFCFSLPMRPVVAAWPPHYSKSPTLGLADGHPQAASAKHPSRSTT